jgi:hypothetical protein
MYRVLLVAMLSLSVPFSSLVAAQNASYTFITIDVPGATSTTAHGINNAGQIVGWSDATGFYGFLKDGTTYTRIEFPGAPQTRAYGINDSGQIVGQFIDAAGRVHGFVAHGPTYTAPEEYTRIEVPGATDTFAYGINNSGQVVGTVVYPTLETYGFVADGPTYTDPAEYTRIEVPGATDSTPLGINDGSQIVGQFMDAAGRSTATILQSLARPHPSLPSPPAPRRCRRPTADRSLSPYQGQLRMSPAAPGCRPARIRSSTSMARSSQAAAFPSWTAAMPSPWRCRRRTGATIGMAVTIQSR